MPDSIEYAQLRATYEMAQKVYEEILREEQHYYTHLEEARTKRLRQEGYLAALETVLRPDFATRVPPSGQEVQDGSQEEQVVEAVVEEGQLDRIGAGAYGGEGHNRLAAQSARQKRGRDNHRG